MIRTGTNHPHFDSMVRIPTDKPIDAIQFLLVIEEILGSFAIDGEAMRLQRDVDVAPPDISLAVRLLDDALVLGRASGLIARIGN